MMGTVNIKTHWHDDGLVCSHLHSWTVKYVLVRAYIRYGTVPYGVFAQVMHKF
jgi:hypothetical protein